MTDQIIDLSMERLRREQDNTKISVEELLLFALDDIHNKTIENPIKAFLCIISDDGERFCLNGYRCGMTKAEELGYQEAFKLQTWKNWIDA